VPGRDRQGDRVRLRGKWGCSAVNDINPSGEATAEEIRRRGGRATFYQADVSDVSSRERNDRGCGKDLGGLDILVNKPGLTC